MKIEKLVTPAAIILGIGAGYLLVKSVKAKELGVSAGKAAIEAVKGVGSGINEGLVSGDASLGTWLYDFTHDNNGVLWGGDLESQFPGLIDYDDYSNPISNGANSLLFPEDENTIGGWVFDQTQKVKAFFGDEDAKTWVEYNE